MKFQVKTVREITLVLNQEEIDELKDFLKKESDIWHEGVLLPKYNNNVVGDIWKALKSN